MNVDQIASAALKLPVRERALLAGSLWESIEDPFAMAESSDDDALLLAIDRDKEIEDGKTATISHAELMRQLRHED